MCNKWTEKQQCYQFPSRCIRQNKWKTTEKNQIDRRFKTVKESELALRLYCMVGGSMRGWNGGHRATAYCSMWCVFWGQWPGDRATECGTPSLKRPLGFHCYAGITKNETKHINNASLYHSLIRIYPILNKKKIYKCWMQNSVLHSRYWYTRYQYFNYLHYQCIGNVNN